MSQADENSTADILQLHPRKVDLTNAERQRRYRARHRKPRKQRKKGVTLPVTPSVTPSVTRPASRAVTMALSGLEPSSAATVTAAPTVTVLPPRRRPSFLAAVVFLLGLATAAVGLYLNASFLWAFGRTSEAGVILAVIGLVTDAMTLVLPAVAAGLWARGRYVTGVTAVTVYALALVMTGLTALGFASTHIGDAVHGRAATITTSTGLSDQRTAAITAAQLAVTAAARAREAECARRGPLCRDRESDERTALERLSAAVAAPVPAVATIGSVDPQIEAAVSVVAWLTRGAMTPAAADIQMLRLLGVATMPILGGLLIAFAMGLGRRADT